MEYDGVRFSVNGRPIYPVSFSVAGQEIKDVIVPKRLTLMVDSANPLEGHNDEPVEIAWENWPTRGSFIRNKATCRLIRSAQVLNNGRNYLESTWRVTKWECSINNSHPPTAPKEKAIIVERTE